MAIELTPAGRALIPRLGPCFGRVARQLQNGFSSADIERLTELLRQLDLRNDGQPDTTSKPKNHAN